MADKLLLLKTACERVGQVGVSTHSFRRTALIQIALQRTQVVAALPGGDTGAETIGGGGDWVLGGQEP